LALVEVVASVTVGGLVLLYIDPPLTTKMLTTTPLSTVAVATASSCESELVPLPLGRVITTFGTAA
jgi:hypothetical protein